MYFQRLLNGKLNRIEFLVRTIYCTVVSVLTVMIFTLLTNLNDFLAYAFLIISVIAIIIYQYSLIKKRLKDVFPGTNSLLSLGIYFVIAAVIPFSSLFLVFLPGDVMNKEKRLE